MKASSEPVLPRRRTWLACTALVLAALALLASNLPSVTFSNHTAALHLFLTGGELGRVSSSR